MRILIDLQPAQGESRFHGIGRYSLKIAEEIVKIKGDEVYILLNDAFPREAVKIKDSLGLPEENYVVFSPIKPTAFINSPEKWRVEVSELIRELAIDKVEPDVVFVPSVFEGFVDNIPISIKKFRNANTAVVLYDLIPLIYAHAYLRDSNMRQWYYYRLNQFRAADAFVAISESSRREGIEHLNLKEEDFCVAYPAPTELFRVLDEPDERVLEKYGISKNYLLYVPSGYDFRKNVEALILAFGRLPKEIKSKLQLVIASKIDEYNERRLKELARKVKANVVLTGYVKDEDLVTLYNLCELFMHPSLHEGFGLPIVEAMACGAPVVGSNSSSIAEIIQRGDALFDPKDVNSISSKILEVLKNDELREELRRYGLKRAKDFSWRESAKNILKLFNKKFGNGRPVAHLFRKPRMAYLSPLPPAQSGISYYSSELLPELSKYYEVELIVNQSDVSDEYIRANFPIRTVEYFTKNFRKYKRVLYHMGLSLIHISEPTRPY